MYVVKFISCRDFVLRCIVSLQVDSFIGCIKELAINGISAGFT